MNSFFDIKPTDLRDFLKYRGWSQVNEAIADGEYLFNHPDYSRQLYFPVNGDVSGFEEAFQMALETLAVFESTRPWLLAKRISESRDDTIVFRTIRGSSGESSIPLTFASLMLEGAQNLLLSAAHTILKPQYYHPRLNRAEARKLLDSARFRHTEPGSFVLKISCPLYALDDASERQPELIELEHNAPFVRKSMALVNKSIGRIILAIEEDSLDALVASEKASDSPSISYNLCSAVTSFYNEGLGNSLEIANHWSILRPVSDPLLTVCHRIQQEYFSRFDEIARELKPADIDIEDTFYGTVEVLDGIIGSDDKRSGDVVLHLLLPKGEIIKTRVNLNAEQYKKANKAHMAAHNAYIKVRGKLKPGKQPQRMTDISDFDLAE